MVSLTELYNIKESALKARDPARGNKGKGREGEFYLVPGPTDPETGARPSKVVYKRSFKNMVKDIKAEAMDMEKLSKELIIFLVSFNFMATALSSTFLENLVRSFLTVLISWLR